MAEQRAYLLQVMMLLSRLRSMRRCEVAFEQRRSIADVVREAISQYIAKRPAKRGNRRLVRGRR